MIVENLNQAKAAIDNLSRSKYTVVDTETTGLRPYHTDNLFSIIMGSAEDDIYYFNFINYPGVDALGQDVIVLLQAFFARQNSWVFHNAKFDLAFLRKAQMFPNGSIYDTAVMGRLECNDHMRYSLADMGSRIGVHKDDAVEKWIVANKAWAWKTIGKSKREKDKYYAIVPFDIITKYGIQDVRTTNAVFKRTTETMQARDEQSPPARPKLFEIDAMESALIPVLVDMEKLGVKIDTEYCGKAYDHYFSLVETLKEDFFRRTGSKFSKGTILFKRLFKKEKLSYTDKGNPIFDAAALKSFRHPAAKIVLKYAAAKKQLEYFEGFLYHVDDSGVIHTNFKQSGTVTGRFSSSSPNLQNLTGKDKYEDSEGSFTPRAAFVPREGYFFAMLDYQQAEYRAMLDMAECTELIDKVKTGTDVHQATADIAGISRKDAKTCNFAILYSSGVQNIADTLGVPYATANDARNAIFKAAPEIRRFLKKVIRTAETRGFIFNKYGRHSYFTDPQFAYRAPNHLIQGMCADICKTAMIRCHEFLKPFKTNMILTIHDELVFEVAKGEAHVLEDLKKIMIEAYDYETLPQGVDIEYSQENLAYKKNWDDLDSKHKAEM